jgi:hypothetical protein
MPHILSSSFPRRRESTRSAGPNLSCFRVRSPVDSRLRGNDDWGRAMLFPPSSRRKPGSRFSSLPSTVRPERSRGTFPALPFRHSHESGNPRSRPAGAYAGRRPWIPAFAGMTRRGSNILLTVIPAKAGISVFFSPLHRSSRAKSRDVPRAPFPSFPRRRESTVTARRSLCRTPSMDFRLRGNDEEREQHPPYCHPGESRDLSFLLAPSRERRPKAVRFQLSLE